MVRKATWILVLLVALIIVSASAAFAASVTRPAAAAITPTQDVATVGKTHELSRGSSFTSHGRGDCPFKADNAAAY